MRLIAPLTLIVLLSVPAWAQSWREYVYPENAFAAAFPDDPKVETSTYKLIDGSTMPSRSYSLTQSDGIFTMLVVDFSASSLGESAIMDQAVATIRQTGEVKLDIEARINRVYGRQLSIGGPDGSHTSVAVFYHLKRLYWISGTALPEAARAGASEAIRFQQSLRFTNDANRNFGFRTLFGAFGRL